jgi:hypothetical protein
MKFYFITLLLLAAAAAAVRGQQTFLFKNESEKFDVRAAFEDCEEEPCRGRTTFYLLVKNREEIFQSFAMSETYVRRGEDWLRRGETIEIFGPTFGGVYFLDYDFDGIEDLALANGDYKPYGGVSYDIFLYSKKAGRFVRNEALSRLSTENVSLRIDRRTRTLETATKSGCCWHERARYRFAGRRLQKFYVFTEDAMSGDGEWMKLVTERLVGGRWRRTTRTVPIKNYYFPSKK